MSKPPLIPDHTLLRPIGHGAYGEVWLARNVMGAFRAVKIIQRDRFESIRPYEREFAGIQRYEPVSRSSAGLVHLLHVGRNEADSYFYYVMELADNAAAGLLSDFDLRISEFYSPRTLRSDLKRLGHLPTADCLRLALDLVSGLAQLHHHQLVHRDVKPGNIIFVEGRAKLTDIGLVSSGGEGRTFVGTEGYIPPEGPGSRGADLYALGVVLYEASTGYPPDRFPDLPTEWLGDPTAAEALEFHEIVLKACEAQRERRYQTAEEMQADLAVLQSGQSVRRVRALERRYTRLRTVGVVGTLFLLSALAVAAVAQYRARLAAQIQARETALRQQAQKSLVRAEIAEQDARQQLYTALLEQARGTARSGELGQRIKTLDAIRRAAAITNAVELRQVVFGALALPDLSLEQDLRFTHDDGRIFDASLERYAECAGGGRGPIEIHAVSDRRLLLTLPAATNATGWVKAWSRDGRFFAVKRDVDQNVGDHADLEVWNVVSTQRVLYLPNAVTERAFCFHPSLPRIATCSRGGNIIIRDLQDPKKAKELSLGADVPYWLCFSDDGNRIAVSYERARSNLVSIIDTASKATPLTVTCPAPAIGLAWQPHGRWLAVPDFSGAVWLIDTKTGESKALGQHKAQAVDVNFSPDGDFLMSGGWERELICWDMRTLQQAFVIGLNSNQAQFSADGTKCGIHMRDRLGVYAFHSPSACRQLPEELGRGVLRGSFSTNGQWLAAAGNDSLAAWNLSTRAPAAIVQTEKGARIPFFSPEGSELYAYGNYSLVRWALKAAEHSDACELEPLPIFVPDRVQSASVRSNELVVTCFGGLSTMPLGNTVAEKVRHYSDANGWGGVISPDGNLLGVRAYNTSPLLRIYRLPEVELVARLTNHAEVCNFAFTPDGAELAVLCASGLEFYDTARWMRTRELPIHSERFGSVCFAPDGQSFWLMSDRRTSSLRDTRTLEVLLPLPSGITPLAVHPDGRHLAVSLDLHRVQVWDIAAVRKSLSELGLDW